MLAYAWNFSDRQPGSWAEEDFFFLLQGNIMQVFGLVVTAISLAKNRSVLVAAWALPSVFTLILTCTSPLIYCLVPKWWSSSCTLVAASIEAFLVLQLATLQRIRCAQKLYARMSLPLTILYCFGPSRLAHLLLPEEKEEPNRDRQLTRQRHPEPRLHQASYHTRSKIRENGTGPIFVRRASLRDQCHSSPQNLTRSQDHRDVYASESLQQRHPDPNTLHGV